MNEQADITAEHYTRISYRQFDTSAGLRALMRVLGWLTLPIVYPMVLLAKLSPETGFRTASEFFSLIPFACGVIVRYQFYRRTLSACGENVFISFGSVFYYPQVRVGDNVLIGMYNTIHHCDFGSDVLTAEGCRFLSGSRYHNFDRIDVPMTRQGGELKRILIGSDVWIGANAVVMANVGDGCVVGAGAVVTKAVEPYQVVAGNPARVVRSRKQGLP